MAHSVLDEISISSWWVMGRSAGKYGMYMCGTCKSGAPYLDCPTGWMIPNAAAAGTDRPANSSGGFSFCGHEMSHGHVDVHVHVHV